MEINDLRHTVTAIILNDNGEVLGVSRKDNHSDFGLAGGKVDEEDLSLVNAIKREVKEETGLDINDMVEILSMPRDMNGKSYWGHSFLVTDWSGVIETDEPHVVKWTTFDELERGSFGSWNKIARDCLYGLGIDVK